MSILLLRSFFIKTLVVGSLLGLGLVGYLSNWLEAEAADPIVVQLSINGGVSASVINGDNVTLDWYISGPVMSCTLSGLPGGPQTIDLSPLPAPVTGSKSFMVSGNVRETYLLNCNGATASTYTTPEPIVNLSTVPTGPVAVDVAKGSAVVKIRWHSIFTDSCGIIERANDSNPTNWIAESSGADYSGRTGTGGTLRFDGSPRILTESATFRITCNNSIASKSTTNSIHVDVGGPAVALAPLTVALTASTNPVERLALYGYAFAEVDLNTTGAEYCSYEAFDAANNPIAKPQGWGSSLATVNKNFRSIRLSDTTKLSVTCGRPAKTFGGNTYPAEVVTKDLTVVVTDPVDYSSLDRLALPPVTITIIPDSVAKSLLSNVTTANLTLDVTDAERCELTAFKAGVEFVLPGWTGSSSGVITNRKYTVEIIEDTRLKVYCYRSFDVRPESTLAEINNGSETRELNLIVPVSGGGGGGLPGSEVLMYGDPDFMSAKTMFDTATANDLYCYPVIAGNCASDSYVYVADPDASGSITFPFKGLSGVYDIILDHCDEPDGESNFTLKDGSGATLGTYVSENHDNGTHDCNNPNKENMEYQRINNNGVALNNGDLLTIECSKFAGEDCVINGLYFGQAEGQPFVATLPADLTANITVDILAVPQYVSASDCVPTTAWYYGNGRYRKHVILSNKTFGLQCTRSSDGDVDSNSITALVAGDAGASASAGLAAGECFLAGVATIPPVGYVADPNPPFLCVLATLPDLAAGDPTLSTGAASTDTANGTYSNLRLFSVIKNLGPGILPINSAVTYKIIIKPHTAWSLPDFESTIGYFNETLADGAQSTGSYVNLFTGVPFGNHNICSRVNLDGSPSLPESNADVDNNDKCVLVTLDIPPPTMIFIADRSIIRPEQTVQLDWDVDVNYELDCVVQGPGVSVSFNTVTDSTSGSVTTGPLTSTSEFSFQCTENVVTGGTVLPAEKVVVEVVPDYEEF